MKPTFLFLILIAITLFSKNTFGLQKPQFDLSLGFTSFKMPISGSSSSGINIGVCLWNIYIDVSSNMATGKGKELNFSSNQTYDSGKTNATVFNFGYNIGVNRNLSFTPFLGFGTTTSIYQDPILFDSYFKGNKKDYFSAGVLAKLFFESNLGAFIGIGSQETFKIGLAYRL